MKNKRNIFAFLLLSLFVWAQAATVLHSAEHGFDDHEHNGKQCELYIFAKHTDAVAPSSAHLTHSALVQHIDTVSHVSYMTFAWVLSENPTRAPPALS